MPDQALVNALFGQPAVGLAEASLEGVILRYNPLLGRMLGYSDEELINTPFVSLIHFEDSQASWDQFGELVRGERPDVRVERRYTHRDGSTVWGTVHLSLTYDQSGSPKSVLAVIQDITAQKLAEEDLQAEREQLEEVWSEVGSGVAIINMEGVVLRAYTGFYEMFRYTEEEACGRPIRELLAPEGFDAELMENLKIAVEGGTINVETVRRRKNGSLIDVAILGRAVEVRGERVIFLQFRDITERKRAEKALERLSMTDELTGLLNRRGFMDVAEKEIDRSETKGKPFLMAYIDLAGFKTINDGWGHSQGDEALVAVAQVLRECCRHSDIVSRVGGDEFVIFGVDPLGQGEYLIPARIKSSIQRVNREGGRPYSINLNIGAVSAPAESTVDLQKILAEADRRMYEQKKDPGRGRQ